MTENKRKFSRSRLTVRVDILRPNGVRIPGTLRDVSMNGMFVRCEEKPLAKEECELKITLDGADPPVRIGATGSIIRTDEEGAAIQLTGIGVESFQHMMRLVMYNSDDPEQVEAEFAEHSGIYPRV